MKPSREMKSAIEELSQYPGKPDEFKIWLKNFLTTKISDPLPDYSLEEFPHEYLQRLYLNTKNTRFQERLRHAVKELFIDWNIYAEYTETVDYFANLLHLIAELPVSEVYSDLIEAAISGFYCDIPASSEKKDVQTLLLKVLIGLPVPGDGKAKRRALKLAEKYKYAYDFRYTPLCFRLAWQLEIENAIQFISPLMKCARYRKFDLPRTLTRFLRGCGAEHFKELIIPMLHTLQPHRLWMDLLETLSTAGVELYLPYHPNLHPFDFQGPMAYLRMGWSFDPQYHGPLNIPFEEEKDQMIVDQIDSHRLERFVDEGKRDSRFMAIIHSNLLDALPTGASAQEAAMSII